ncbi:glycine cleavage system transcriptional repressor [Motilibacter rhizosphaerae]|uniref:Glycine cleavage system transcriptional repressor n=1 Tax=Motilibacter rhizosphaerae TaxID=598652 RepID=A0A4V2F4E7_9ACTN|nr:ACT domain-containing protein [Motilibacter rhizosphaerae]RZS87347.1 glycine cleavage system transcriptional repressor [Motilibacter rhizosphaerae]
MPQLAVTVLGEDRPGIVAETTRALAAVGGNLEDSTMTLLRGSFAMVLVVTAEAGAAEVEAALAPLADDDRLAVSVREVHPSAGERAAGSAYLLSVHGGDRPGIVSALTGELAAVGGNVTDLTTRLSGELYVLLAEVDLPEGTDVPALEAAVRSAATGLGVDATLRPLDADLL